MLEENIIIMVGFIESLATFSIQRPGSEVITSTNPSAFGQFR